MMIDVVDLTKLKRGDDMLVQETLSDVQAREIAAHIALSDYTAMLFCPVNCPRQFWRTFNYCWRELHAAAGERGLAGFGLQVVDLKEGVLLNLPEQEAGILALAHARLAMRLAKRSGGRETVVYHLDTLRLFLSHIIKVIEDFAGENIRQLADNCLDDVEDEVKSCLGAMAEPII